MTSFNNGLKVNVIKGASAEAITSATISCLSSKSIATEKATEASVSASSSSMQASIATAQAVISTTKASEASVSASNSQAYAQDAANLLSALSNVDNTSDLDKPVSNATQTALNLKANLASPTFTGTVSGISKSMVGLANVDNTADSAKVVASAAKLTTARTINGELFDGTADIMVATKKVDMLYSLRTITEAYETVWVSGYHTKNDGAFGSHIFRLKGVKTTETDNSGTVTIATIGGVDYVYELQYDGAVNVKWFGAKGDGVTDDFSAINTALSVANGNRIIFDSGKKYLIGSPITFNGDVSLSTDGAGKAIIFHNGQSFTPLTISGTLSHTTTLTQSQQINNRDWVVANAGLVEKGMLMEVISSASWYHDPRPDSTDARKSELHRVSSVSGNTISTEDIANDGYILPDETVTIKFYTPVSVSIENMAIHCVLPFPAESTPAVTGIRISYANEPLLMDIDVENAAAVGIGFTGCYRPVCLRGHTHSSNDYGTGYGVQLYGSSHAIIRDRTFWQCRRGVDVSGAQVVSRHTLIESCTNLGGGINSKGEIYGWNDGGLLGAPQFGFGSHGPADNTIYRENRVAQMHTPFNIRGRNEIIEDNYIIGRTRYGVISCAYGENIWIKNNKVYSGWSNLKAGIVVEGGGNINTRRADWFIRFLSSYQGGNIVIENNDVQVQDRFVSFDSDSVQQSISISRNKVRYATQLSEDPVFFAYNEGTAQSISSWQILNNDYARESGTGTVRLFNNLILDNKSNLGEVGSYTGKYTPAITNVINVTSSISQQVNYSVVGNIVTIMGGFTLTFAAANINSTVSLSLPIPKDFVSIAQAKLTGTPYTYNSRDVLSGQADVTNNEIVVRCFASASGQVAFNYLAMYEI